MLMVKKPLKPVGGRKMTMCNEDMYRRVMEHYALSAAAVRGEELKYLIIGNNIVNNVENVYYNVLIKNIYNGYLKYVGAEKAIMGKSAVGSNVILNSMSGKIAAGNAVIGKAAEGKATTEKNVFENIVLENVALESVIAGNAALINTEGIISTGNAKVKNINAGKNSKSNAISEVPFTKNTLTENAVEDIAEYADIMRNVHIAEGAGITESMLREFSEKVVENAVKPTVSNLINNNAENIISVVNNAMGNTVRYFIINQVNAVSNKGNITNNKKSAFLGNAIYKNDNNIYAEHLKLNFNRLKLYVRVNNATYFNNLKNSYILKEQKKRGFKAYNEHSLNFCNKSAVMLYDKDNTNLYTKYNLELPVCGELNLYSDNSFKLHNQHKLYLHNKNKLELYKHNDVNLYDTYNSSAIPHIKFTLYNDKLNLYAYEKSNIFNKPDLMRHNHNKFDLHIKYISELISQNNLDRDNNYHFENYLELYYRNFLQKCIYQKCIERKCIGSKDNYGIADIAYEIVGKADRINNAKNTHTVQANSKINTKTSTNTYLYWKTKEDFCLKADDNIIEICKTKLQNIIKNQKYGIRVTDVKIGIINPAEIKIYTMPEKQYYKHDVNSFIGRINKYNLFYKREIKADILNKLLHIGLLRTMTEVRQRKPYTINYNQHEPSIVNYNCNQYEKYMIYNNHNEPQAIYYKLHKKLATGYSKYAKYKTNHFQDILTIHPEKNKIEKNKNEKHKMGILYRNLRETAIINKQHCINSNNYFCNMFMRHMETGRNLYYADSITNNIIDDISSDFTNNITDDIDNDFTNNIINDIANGFAKNVTNHITNGFANSVTNHITNGFAKNITNYITNDLANNITNNISNDLTNNVIKHITKNISNNISNDISNDVDKKAESNYIVNKQLVHREKNKSNTAYVSAMDMPKLPFYINEDIAKNKVSNQLHSIIKRINKSNIIVNNKNKNKKMNTIIKNAQADITINTQSLTDKAYNEIQHTQSMSSLKYAAANMYEQPTGGTDDVNYIHYLSSKAINNNTGITNTSNTSTATAALNTTVTSNTSITDNVRIEQNTESIKEVQLSRDIQLSKDKELSKDIQLPKDIQLLNDIHLEGNLINRTESLHDIVTEKEKTEEINKIVDARVQSHVKSISKQVYETLERKLRDEKRRRGF